MSRGFPSSSSVSVSKSILTSGDNAFFPLCKTRPCQISFFASLREYCVLDAKILSIRSKCKFFPPIFRSAESLFTMVLSNWQRPRPLPDTFHLLVFRRNFSFSGRSVILSHKHNVKRQSKHVSSDKSAGCFLPPRLSMRRGSSSFDHAVRLL